MVTRLTPDVCVIGATSGALRIAAGVSARGHSVALVAREGFAADLLDYGSGALAAWQTAGQRAHDIRTSEAFGLGGGDPAIDFRAVQRHVRQVRDDLAREWLPQRFAALGVHIIGSDANFTDRNTLLAGDVEVRAKRFVVGTGSVPKIPDIAGLDTFAYLTEETLPDLTRRPASVLVVGSGQTAIGYAQALQRLGSNVTLIAQDSILPEQDPEHTEILLRQLRSDGIAIMQETALSAVERRGKTGVRVHLHRGGTADTIDGTHLFLALGRQPATDVLNLDKVDKSRLVLLDPTENATAEELDLRAAHLAASLPSTVTANVKQTLLPRVTRSDPPIASVGLNEAEAVTRHKRLTVLRWPYAHNAQAIADRRISGSIKVLADQRGNIVGVSIAGAGAGEMIGTWAIAISRSMTLSDIGKEVPPSGSIAEIGKSAVMSYSALRASRPKKWWFPSLFRSSR